MYVGYYEWVELTNELLEQGELTQKTKYETIIYDKCQCRDLLAIRQCAAA